jgi:hypothetical protein
LICKIHTDTGGSYFNIRHLSPHQAGSARQPRGVDLEEDETQSQRFETADEYDTLKHTVDKGAEPLPVFSTVS